tara:strand:- start:86 stop:511 length:426 start_codon:yes stop_codon:yes gene_type:complete
MLKVKKLSQFATLPQKAHSGDLGYDLFASKTQDIFPDETKIISTDICIELPEGYGAVIKDRSSVSTKKSLFTVAGVIDNGYIGPIGVAFHNASSEVVEINIGDKIAQLVLIPTVNFSVEEVEEVFSSDKRGTGGFGSTGAQ